MTLKEVQNCIAEYCNTGDERVALCILAEPDGDDINISCNMHGVEFMLSYILADLMHSNPNLRLMLKTAVKMTEFHEHEKKSDS